MKMLSDFFPIILFFITYKFFGIYIATATAIAVSLLQVVIYGLLYRKLDRMQLITLALILLFGGATLLLHEEIYIKWKPTVLNWLFGLIFAASHLIGEKPIIRRLMEKNIDLPQRVWTYLNISWIVFFFLMGCANLYVVYHFTTDIWVNFKLFGVLGLTIIFVIIQAIFLAKHVTPSK